MAKTETDLPEPLTPFEAFTDLLRQVVAVPKAELDKREAVYQEGRAKKKRAKEAQKAPPDKP